MKLNITYIPNEGVNWKGLCAVIGYAGRTFIELGLRKGQQTLTEQEMAWLLAHEDAIVRCCVAKGKMFDNWLNITSKERQSRLKEYQPQVGYSLLDAFCRDCKIQDS